MEKKSLNTTEEGRYKNLSFNVSADLDLLDQLYEGENWPRSITVKRFNFFRPKKLNNGAF